MVKDWIGETKGLTNALSEINSAYQDELHVQVKASLESQEKVTARLRKFEKEISTTAGNIFKLVGKADHTQLFEDTTAISEALDSAEATIEECIEKIRVIEQHIPISKRLVNPQLSNIEKYPLLHEYMIEKSKPELMHLTLKATPQAELSKPTDNFETG